MITELNLKKKVLGVWSKEVQLATKEGLFICKCGCEHQVTVGRPDRVRCPKCNEVYHVDL